MIRGIGPAQGKTYAPGAKTDVHVYFEVVRTVPTAYRFQLLAWPNVGAPTDPLPPAVIRSANRVTLDGTFATTRWRVGDKVRERFAITIPPEWSASEMRIGLVAADANTGTKARATGLSPGNDSTIAVLGTLPVVAGSPAPKPP